MIHINLSFTGSRKSKDVLSTRPLRRMNMYEFTHSVQSDIFYGVIYLQLHKLAMVFTRAAPAFEDLFNTCI